MAVDYQTPLVTNVKNAKILIEALARNYGMEILKIDAQETLTRPLPPKSPEIEPVQPSLIKRNRRESILSLQQRLRPMAHPSPLLQATNAGMQPMGMSMPTLQGMGSQGSMLPSLSANLQYSNLLQYSNILQLIATSPFKQNHVLSVSDFTHEDVHHLFTAAQEMRLGVERHGVLDILRGRVLCTMFYEPSTRTSASFDAAMQRLGGRTVVISSSYSSTQKGESLADTIRTLACYGDAIVLRHPDASSAQVAAQYSPVPIINGGNGSVEHPTQAFLDLFTIREELGSVKKNLVITFTGDLKYGRTVHSLVRLLELYNETKTVQIQLVSPSALALPTEIRRTLVESGRLLAESETLTPEIVARTDVLYCTRVQKERFEDPAEYEGLKDRLVVNNRVLRAAKQRMIVMHPLPRNNEIAEEVDYDGRAAYFRQVSTC